MITIGNYINGKRVTPKLEKKSRVYNPATGKQSAEMIISDAKETSRAVESAHNAFAAWSQMSPLRRARIFFKFNELLQQNNDRIVEAISREHGKVWGDAQGELTRGREVVEFACGIPQLLKGEISAQVANHVDTCSINQPLGVCVGITPFNFPAMVPMWMFPIAIACGNTFVLKPSEKDPSAPLLLAELLTESGLPDGVFNVVNGDKEAVDSLIENPLVKAVSFVGSTPVARYINQKASIQGKRVQALGGAKNHMVVMPDADLDVAASSLIGASFGSAGERCMAISIAVLVGDIADDFIGILQKKMAQLSIGPSFTKGSDYDYGPVVSQEHKEKILAYVQSGIEQGAELIVDGRDKTINGYEKGFFVGACLFDKVTVDMKIYQEEIFGPVLSIVRVHSIADALQLVNQHEFGNGASIFTQSGAVARDFSHNCLAGMVGINAAVPAPVAFHSFGGWKNSAFADHDAHGPSGVRFYTRSKKITSRWDSESQKSNVFHMPTLG